MNEGISKLRECVAENLFAVEPTMQATELLVKGEKTALPGNRSLLIPGESAAWGKLLCESFPHHTFIIEKSENLHRVKF